MKLLNILLITITSLYKNNISGFISSNASQITFTPNNSSEPFALSIFNASKSIIFGCTYLSTSFPKFDIPNEFLVEEDKSDAGKRGENKYLRHLTYEGAKKRYGELSEAVIERLDFELATIEKTGYPGYY